MSNRLSFTGTKFRSKFKKINGSVFYGQLLDIPDTSRVSNFISPRRYLRTTTETNVIPTDVIIADGVKYIVGEHGTGFYNIPIYKHFKLFQVDHVADWSKKVLRRDNVTGVNKICREDQTEKVYISLQPKSSIEDLIKIPAQTYIAVANREVSKDDEVYGKLVTKVDFVLGVYLLELKDI